MEKSNFFSDNKKESNRKSVEQMNSVATETQEVSDLIDKRISINDFNSGQEVIEDTTGPFNNFQSSQEVEERQIVKNILRKSTSSSNSGYSITVRDPQIKEGVGGYTSYLVDCSLLKQPTYKRYSDFYALRQKLIERWPGIFIPSLPPKKLVGNKESQFIESRCKMLNTFSQKLLCNFNYLFKSEEFKIFLQSNDVEKDMNKLTSNLEDIMIKYKNSFVNIIDDKGLESNYYGKINSFLNTLMKSDKFIKIFKEIIKTSYERKTLEIESYQSLLNSFSEYEKQTLLDISSTNDLPFTKENPLLIKEMIKIKDRIVNPYAELFNWIQEEESENEAFIDSIKSYNDLFIKRNDMSNKKKEVEQLISELELGKSSIKTLFSFKSKTDDITDQKNLNIKVSQYI